MNSEKEKRKQKSECGKEDSSRNDRTFGTHNLLPGLYSTLNTAKCCSSEIREDLAIRFFSIVCTKNQTHYPVVTADSNIYLNQV
jgi:hypothetical protein